MNKRNQKKDTRTFKFNCEGCEAGFDRKKQFDSHISKCKFYTAPAFAKVDELPAPEIQVTSFDEEIVID